MFDELIAGLVKEKTNFGKLDTSSMQQRQQIIHYIAGLPNDG